MARAITFVKPAKPNPIIETPMAAKKVGELLNTPLLVKEKMMDVIVGKGLINVYEIGRDKAFTSAAFQQMMRTVGWKSSQFWCLYYAKAVYYQMFSFDREMINRNISGGTLRTFRDIQEKNKQGFTKLMAIAEDSPQVGDIFILKSTSRKGGGHAGIVTEVIDNNKIKTIEGNTSLSGSRSGQGVFQLTRSVGVGQKFGNFILQGYIRRVFTDEEKSKLTWDEANKTFVFSDNPTQQPTEKAPTKNIIENLFSFIGGKAKDVSAIAKRQQQSAEMRFDGDYAMNNADGGSTFDEKYVGTKLYTITKNFLGLSEIGRNIKFSQGQKVYGIEYVDAKGVKYIIVRTTQGNIIIPSTNYK